MPTCTSLHQPLSRIQARLRQQRGQAMVEFAVVLPVLLLVILGILYFGRYESYSNQMTQLAEVGARDASVAYSVPASSVNGTTCATGVNTGNIACYIASQATGEIAAGNGNVQAVSVWVDCAGGSSCTQGSNVTACLQAKVQFPGLQISAGTIYQQATIRVEQGSAQTPTAQDSYLVEPASGNGAPSAGVGSLPSNPPC